MIPAKWKHPSLAVVHCPFCGFVGLNTDHCAFPRSKTDYYDGVERPEGDINQFFMSHRVGRIREFASSGRVLELGCGLGETAILLDKMGYDVCAVDNSQKAIAALRRLFPSVKWHCTRIEDHLYNIPDQDYDLVLMYHVIEHLLDPGKICSEIHRVLKHGGLAVIEVPNFNGLHRKLWGNRWWYWLDHHLNYFTVGTLGRLMEAVGFRLLLSEGKYHFSYPQGVLWKDTAKWLLARMGFADVITTFWQKQQLPS
jgi:SAM-dependent methyltransferase